jgi:hypothetical protein
VTAQVQANRPEGENGIRRVWQGFLAAISSIEFPRDRLVLADLKWSDSGSFSESTSDIDSGCNASNIDLSSGNPLQGKGNLETDCKILKQFADRFHYEYRPWTKVVCDYFLSGICMHWKHICNGLSRREAKFFLDRGKQSSYHCHKFLGDFPAGAKFHLHAKGKVVDCCSPFWRGANVFQDGHDGTRFRKAETGRPIQVSDSIPRMRSLREDRPFGFKFVPGAHGRRRIENVPYTMAG